jgi:hypothetical protein
VLGGKRWRPARRIFERREQIQRQLIEARQRSGQLHRALPHAERRDRERRGRAVAEGKSRPQLEAPQIASELEDIQQRVQDLEAAAAVVDQDLQRLRRDNRDSWSERQAGKLEQAKGDVFAAASELEAKVSAFEDELALLAWASSPVDQQSVDPAGGRLTHTGTIAAALDQVRAAVTGLAVGQDKPAPPPQREPTWVEKRLAARSKPGWG